MGKLQIISDIHLEYLKNDTVKIEPCAENLALLGDIGYPESLIWQEFITEQSKQFEKVFLVMGNHDYYSEKPMTQVLSIAKSYCEKFTNVFLLDNESYDVSENTTLVGSTLWSNIDKYSARFLSDMKNIYVESETEIQLLSQKDYIDMHKKCVSFIDETIESFKNKNKKLIVLTHHAPLDKMNGKYQKSLISSAFTTDLKNLFRKPVIAFANGHVHSNCDIVYNNIRCVSNTFGYFEEETGFKMDVVIDF